MRPATTIPARTAGNVAQFIRATIDFNTPDIATGVQIGTIPAGAVLGQAIAKVVTAFNAASTNVVTVGTVGPTYNNIMGAAEVVEGTLGATFSTVGGALTFLVDTPVYARYTQTGTPATTGRAIVILPYACE